MSEVKVHLLSAGAPNGVGEYHWETPESVVAVPEDIALPLLRISGGGFTVAEKYEALPKKQVTKVDNAVKATKPEPTPEFVAGNADEANQLGTALTMVSPKGTRSRKA